MVVEKTWALDMTPVALDEFGKLMPAIDSYMRISRQVERLAKLNSNRPQQRRHAKWRNKHVLAMRLARHAKKLHLDTQCEWGACRGGRGIASGQRQRKGLTVDLGGAWRDSTAIPWAILPHVAKLNVPNPCN